PTNRPIGLNKKLLKYNELTPTAFWWVVLSHPTAGLNFCFSKDFAGGSKSEKGVLQGFPADCFLIMLCKKR
ncbi:MAG: hypothetical protein IK065_07055, partial [Neisseriaceae bacterium]|nr:hypothetical protein [Neisseriaceae bacterium]